VIYTSFDIVEYLLSTTGGGAQDQEHRVLRQAVFHAYREVVTIRDWLWHHTTDTLRLSDTGPITTYTLPWGVQSVDSVHLNNPEYIAEYVAPTLWDRLAAGSSRNSVSPVWSLFPSASAADRWDIRVLSHTRPGDACTLTYRRRPRDLRLTGWEPSSRAGTVSWANGEVAGDKTQFSSHMVGAVLRVSGDAAYHPESLAGMHPFRDEGVITRVANSNSMYAWSPAGALNYSGTKYIVTDLLDISPNMYTAVLSCAEVWLARLMGKNIAGAMAVFQRDLRLAFEQDAVAPISGQREMYGCYYPFWFLWCGDCGGGGGSPEACPTPSPADGGGADGNPPRGLDGGGATTQFDGCGNAPN
jgi:hypothetical protein